MPGEFESPGLPAGIQASAADWIGPRIKEVCEKQKITKYRLSQMTELRSLSLRGSFGVKISRRSRRWKRYVPP